MPQAEASESRFLPCLPPLRLTADNGISLSPCRREGGTERRQSQANRGRRVEGERIDWKRVWMVSVCPKKQEQKSEKRRDAQNIQVREGFRVVVVVVERKPCRVAVLLFTPA